jgi:hypothetical protein
MSGPRRSRALLPGFSLGLALGVLLVPRVAEARDTTAVARCTKAAEAGQRLRSRSELRAAAKELALCVASECPGIVRRDCGNWLEETQNAIPTVVFSVLDAASHDVRQGTITFDGEVLADAIDGHAVSLDPGTHHVTFVNGTDRHEEDVVIRQGERNRILVLRLDGSVGTRNKRFVSVEPPATTSVSPSWPWIIGGAGIVAAGIGGGFWYAGNKKHSDLGESCAPSHSCDDAEVSRGKTQILVGDILVGIGALALTTAVVWLIAGPHPSRAPSVRSASR